MYTTIIEALKQWNAAHGERAKLQHGYIGLVLATVIIAGLVGLINYDLGQRLTTLALILLTVFFINLVTWTLLSGLLLSSLDEPAKPTGAKRTTSARPKSK